jgi:DNA polymerase V
MRVEKRCINFYQADPSGLLIPVFNHSGIHAGFPSPAMDYVQERISLDDLLIKNPASTFIADVEGDSMTGAFVPDKARLVIDRSITPQNGSMVVAVVNGEYVLRKYQKSGDKVILRPANAKYHPITITEDMDFQVWGVVIHILINTQKLL